MRRLDFEQAVLEMVFEAGYERLTPANVAFFLKVPIKMAEAMLDELVQDSILQLECNDEGHIVYSLPAHHRPRGEAMQRTLAYRANHGEGGAPLQRRVKHEAPAPPPQRAPEPQRAVAAGTAPVAGWQSASVQDASQLWYQTPQQSYPLARRADPTGATTHLPACLERREEVLARIERRSPTVSMMLSFLWPGLGQVYNGQPGKGLVMFFTSAFLWMVFLGWLVHVYALVDAGIVAHRMNQNLDRRRALMA